MSEQFHLAAVLDLAKKISEILALWAGGVWGYYRFIRSRTFKPRLDVSIFGRLYTEKKSTYLIVSSKVVNIGLCKVNLKQEGTAVEIFSAVPKEAADSLGIIEWKKLETLSVFEKHHSLEPGEPVSDEILVRVPNSGQVFKVELRIVAKGIEWNTLAILKGGIDERKGRPLQDNREQGGGLEHDNENGGREKEASDTRGTADARGQEGDATNRSR